MLEHGSCPQCQMPISEERRRTVPVVCNHCGFVSHNDEQVHEQIEKNTTKIYVGVSIFMVAAFIQISNWDKHALGIIPISIKETLGMNSPSDLEAKAQMCFDLKKWDCVETQYVYAGKTDARQMLRAGDFQMKRQKYQAAAESYYSFFKAGGESLEASYSYAKALAKLGQVDEAIKYFEQVLAARPEVLQVTVTQNYVKLLMDNQRYDQAKVLIKKIREQAGPSGEQFMNDEYQQIQQLTTASR